MTTEIKERIVKYSKELRLPTFRGEFEVHASEAAKQEASYEEYLLGLMEKEYYTRVENRKKSQIRQAGFPQKHYLHDLQKELLPDNARQKLPLLERLDFIKEGRNVVLAGNPGTGKTHIATGLGIKACQHNYKVLFTTVPRLITQLRESHSEHTLRQVEHPPASTNAFHSSVSRYFCPPCLKISRLLSRIGSFSSFCTVRLRGCPVCGSR
jgi:DNA replication protein DnaC